MLTTPVCHTWCVSVYINSVVVWVVWSPWWWRHCWVTIVVHTQWHSSHWLGWWFWNTTSILRQASQLNSTTANHVTVTLKLFYQHLIKYCLRSYDGVDHVCVACKVHIYIYIYIYMMNMRRNSVLGVDIE